MIVVPNASSVDLQSCAIYKKMRFDVACRPFVRTVLVPSDAITQAVESKGEAGARLGLNILDNVRGPVMFMVARQLRAEGSGCTPWLSHR